MFVATLFGVSHALFPDIASKKMELFSDLTDPLNLDYIIWNSSFSILYYSKPINS